MLEFSFCTKCDNDVCGLTIAQLNSMFMPRDEIIADYVSHEYLIDNYNTIGDSDNRYIRLDKKFPNFTINYWGDNSVSYNCKTAKTVDLAQITGQSILYGNDELNQPEVQQKTIYDVLTNLLLRIEDLEVKINNNIGENI